jgi:alkylation response protein AidB-like acyl-CoA dehydrogenase
MSGEVMPSSVVESSSVLTVIRALVPEITTRADEIERSRSVPADLCEKLRAAGAFRMFIPKQYGGEELHSIEVSRILEELGRADASVAWTVMVAVGFNVFFGRFPHALIEKLFSASPDVLARGAIAPQGVAVPTDGGYRVRGRWGMGSGSYNYQWVMGTCIVHDNGKPRMTATGTPETRLVLVRREAAKFLDTWDSVGLRGTASHDFVLEEQFVPESYTGSLSGPAGFDTPIYRLPFALLAMPTHAAAGDRPGSAGRSRCVGQNEAACNGRREGTGGRPRLHSSPGRVGDTH